MMSLVAREVANRLPQSASGASRRASKAHSGFEKAPRSFSQAHGQRRAYSTPSVPAWDTQDAALLGTYKGIPTARGQNKTSTGLVGLDVQPHAREILIELYKKMAVELTKFPADFSYRVDNEHYLRRRLSILLEETDIIRLEEEIDDGQLETLIAEAQEDLSNEIPSLLELKPWATPVNKWETKRPYLYTDVEIL